MPEYKLDQKKKNQDIKGVKRTRLVLLGSYAIMLIPLYIDEIIQGSATMGRDLLFYIVGILAIVFWFYSSAPKVFSEVRIEPDKKDKNDIVIIKDQISIPMRRVKFIQETPNGLGIHSFGRKLWIPKAIRRYDEFKEEILSNVDAEVFSWTRLPTLWFWVALSAISLVGAIYFKDLLMAYTGVAVSAANITYLLFYE